MRLHEVTPGQTVEIKGYHAGCSMYRAKLLALGLTRGTRIRLVNVAPLGDPVELEVRGFSLSLRKDEAAVLDVVKV